jgi:MIP family channel proteins
MSSDPTQVVAPESSTAGRDVPWVRTRRLFTEAFGTFLLVIIDAGGAVIAQLGGGEVTPEARSLATGLLIMAMIYAMGDISGAHFNPAVTFAFALRRVFPWRLVPTYWLAQIMGAFTATFTLRALFGDVADLGATLPRLGMVRALAMEVILTCILVSMIIGTATRHRIVGPNAALAAGRAVALSSLFARPVSGASMNPARSIGPAVVSGRTEALWIYVAGPLAGALLATLVMFVIHSQKHRYERKAAQGEEK